MITNCGRIRKYKDFFDIWSNSKWEESEFSCLLFSFPCRGEYSQHSRNIRKYHEIFSVVRREWRLLKYILTHITPILAQKYIYLYSLHIASNQTIFKNCD